MTDEQLLAAEAGLEGAGGNRPVVARWTIVGELELLSAAHFGSGEEGDTVDMALRRDPVTGEAVLSGESIAGALRSYGLDRLLGYFVPEPAKAPAGSAVATLQRLLGAARGNPGGGQSEIISFDAFGFRRGEKGRTSPVVVAEVRDGVAIKPELRTAEDHKKFDLEVLPHGTRFLLRFDWIVADTASEAELLSILRLALQGFEVGDIPIGARRSRGLGECYADCWKARRYDLATEGGWCEWLASDHELTRESNLDKAGFEILDGLLEKLLPGFKPCTTDERRRCVVLVDELKPVDGVLIGSPPDTPTGADRVHLRSGGKPVLSGSSLAGALIARARRIARVARPDDADAFLENLVGPRMHGTTASRRKPRVSRLRVGEPILKDIVSLHVSRHRSDRFTGGVCSGLLFDEQPAFGGRAEQPRAVEPNPLVKPSPLALRIEVREPRAGEIGLTLRTVMDLVDRDLPVGATAKIGRGVFEGSFRIRLENGDGKPVEVLEPFANAEHRKDAETYLGELWQEGAQ